MADEKDAESGFATEVLQERHDLTGHGDIKRTRCLVADEEFGRNRQRPGNGSTLTLPAAHFMRITRSHVSRQSAAFEQLGCASIRFMTGTTLIAKRLADPVAQCSARVKRGRRLLKNHLHRAVDLAQRPFIQMRNIVPFQENRSSC